MEKNRFNIIPKMKVKDIIIYAFQEMLKEQTFEKITVNDLVNVCGVSRTSFYRHFEDKYDLLIQIYKNQIKEILEDSYSIKENIRQVIELMYEERKYLSSALLHDTQSTLKKFIFKEAKKIYISQLQTALKTDRLSDDILTAIDFACAGSEYVWSAWLLQGAKESPQVIARRIFDNTPQSLARYCK